MSQTTIKGYVEGPRWAGIDCAMRTMAFMNDLEIEIDIEKGWLIHVFRYKVTGEQSGIEAFRKELRDSLEDYNRRIDAINAT